MATVSIFNQLPNKLFKPSNISLFASLGLHALFLAYILPNLSLSRRDKQAEQPSSVRLTELTPAEQSRLPDLSPFSLEPLDPLSLPNRSALNTPLPDLSTLDLPRSTELLPPPLLPESNLPPVNSIFPRLPAPPLPPPPQIILPPPRQIPLPELKPTAPRDSAAESPTPPSRPTVDPPQVQEPSQPQAPPRFPPLQPYATLPVLPEQSSRPPLPFAPPSPSEGARDLLNKPQASDAAKPSSPPTEERQTAANSDAASSAPLPAPDAIEEQRQQQLVAEILKRRESMRTENTGTTDEEARKNFLSWSSTVEAAEIKPEELNLTGKYPKDACIKKLEGTSVYGILIDAQGKITDRELIKSSGYPLFNERALETIKTSSFSNKTGQPKPYLVRVNFDYSPEICPSLSLTPPKPDSPQEQIAPPATVAAPETAPSSEAAAEKPEPPPASETESKPNQSPVAPPSGAAAEKPSPSPAPAARSKPSPKVPETTRESVSPSERLGGPIEGTNPFTQPTPDSTGESEE